MVVRKLTEEELSLRKRKDGRCGGGLHLLAVVGVRCYGKSRPTCNGCWEDRRGRNGHDTARVLEQKRYAFVKRKYGLSREEYDTIVSGQCGVCGKRGGLEIDHDHLTGKVRGGLCPNCNKAVGLLKDDPALLRRAAEYVSNR